MVNRREFMSMVALLGAGSLSPLYGYANRHKAKSNKLEDYYKIENYGNVRLLHMTDSHAQLMPVYFREPSVNIGLFAKKGFPPHLVGKHLLKHYNITDPKLVYAYSCINFEENAKRLGKTGGFAHMKTLIDYLRNNYGSANTLLLDGGDTWQGSATALWSRGKDMVGAMNILGLDIMTGHWEFTYQEKEVHDNIKHQKGDFIAHNVKVKEDALMDGAEAYDEDEGYAFKPYTIKVVNGNKIAVIGQAFPYTSIANPQRFIPNWSFGIQNEQLQELVNDVKKKHKPDAVVLLSHNGADVDVKLAEVVNGIDFIMGGHTHDGIVEPIKVKNSNGYTYVMNAGSNAKFLGVLDINIQKHKIKGFKYSLLPVFSNLIPENKEMANYIAKVRKPHLKKLNEKLAKTDDLLYRRGNFNGSFDQIICDALLQENDAEVSLSPGFRWGTSVLPGGDITFDDVMNHTAITYPETYMKEIKGKDIKAILEDVADNLFNKDPFYQQGGDMVRTGGISYTIRPKNGFGKRISELRLVNGKPIADNKKYKVAGWSTVGSKSPGAPVWEQVTKYLKAKKHLKNINVQSPKIIGLHNNPGIV